MNKTLALISLFLITTAHTSSACWLMDCFKSWSITKVFQKVDPVPKFSAESGSAENTYYRDRYGNILTTHNPRSIIYNHKERHIVLILQNNEKRQITDLHHRAFIEALTYYLYEEDCPIKTLSLRAFFKNAETAPVKEAFLNALNEFLSNYTTLKVLNLADCELNCIDFNCFASGIGENITSLILSGNNLDYKACELLRDVLENDKEIKLLNLSSNPIGFTGVFKWIQFCKEHPSLNTLHLKHCDPLKEGPVFEINQKALKDWMKTHPLPQEKVVFIE